MSLDELTITLSDKDGRLSVETLSKALENALEMLRAIEATVVAADVEVHWDVVRASMRSPLRLTLSPRVRKHGRTSRATGRKLVSSAMSSLVAVESGAEVPRYVTEDALLATRRLIKEVGKDGGAVTFAAKSSSSVTLTDHSVQRIGELAAKARLYIDFSTIEGRLEMLSVHDHNSVFVWEVLTGHRIECFVDDLQLDQARDLLGKRVAVSGRVHYRNHVPKTIHVDGPIRVLRESSELPQPGDIGPIDLTEGLSSEEHVRRMRNA